ncbi:MAG TPA: redoxin domain-containing protein [Acidimicrobiales bacterium]|nr:redoxin domain-containing protein [Acidimicrobiales bacterium]
MLSAGDPAPSFTLPDAFTGETVADPWEAGGSVLVFFKVTCPVCHMVAPKVTALADAGVPVLAIGQDPPAKLVTYADDKGQAVPTVSDVAPYPVSSSFGIASVPTLFDVGPDGVITNAVAAWDRERWNAVAAAHGAPPLSSDGDGLPPYRPG